RESINSTVQLRLDGKVDGDGLVDLKERLGREVKEGDEDVKLSVSRLLGKGVVVGVKEYGGMNAGYEEGELSEYEDVDLGMGRCVDEGVMVGVINDGDRKSMGSLGDEIK
uniref:2-oxo acid dehydrogenase subunit E2 n=1 Tax=Staphylococcus epidermidis TaxID=1282 RepID=UPI0011A4ADD6